MSDVADPYCNCIGCEIQRAAEARMVALRTPPATPTAMARAAAVRGALYHIIQCLEVLEDMSEAVLGVVPSDASHALAEAIMSLHESKRVIKVSL